MAIHNTPEERQIIKLLEKLTFVEAERQAWIDDIQATGMNEELAEAIHQRLSTPAEGEAQAHNRSTVVVEYAQLVRRWRLSLGAKKFARSR